MVHIEALHRDVISIPIGGLYLMDIETGREEHHRLAACSHQCIIDIGCHPTGVRENSQGGGLENGKIAIAAAHPHDRLHVGWVAICVHDGAVLHCPYLQILRCIDKAITFEIAGTMLEHGQRFIHTDHQGVAHAASEPLHFHFDIARRDL